MDLSNPFGTLNHELLIAKLHAYGFGKESLMLLFRVYTKVCNHPQPSTTTHHPQPPKKTTHKHPELPRTIHNHPKVTQKSQNLSQTCYCTLDVNAETGVSFDSDMKQWYIYMFVFVYMYFISYYI